MSRNDTSFKRITLSMFFYAFLVPLAVGATPGLDHAKAGCDTMENIPLNSVVHNAGAQKCYAVEVFSPGLLAIELSPTGNGGGEARIDDILFLCDPPDVKHASFDILEQLAKRQLLAVRDPGTYRFCVSAEDVKEAPRHSKLGVLFLPAWTTKDGDPREEEPDPDLMVQEPSASELLEQFRGVCHALAADDHGDSFLCATPLQLGVPAEGEIWNVWGDDDDLFVFALGVLTTVRLEATLQRVAFGGLYDRYGHRLHVETRGDSQGWYVVTTLAPGPYAVRLTGDDGQDGAYQLQVTGPER